MALSQAMRRFLVMALLGLSSVHGCVPVTVVYPDDNLAGHALFLRGSGGGLTWDKGIAMDHSSANTWTLCVSEGGIDVKPLVDDDVWANGANTHVPAGGGFVYPWFVYTEGSYWYIRDVHSPQLNNTRDLVVYVPPSYFENTFKVRLRDNWAPVMYTYICISAGIYGRL